MAYTDPHDPRLKAKRKEWYENNKDRHRAGVKLSKLRRQSVVNEAKAKPCTDCGVTYPYYVMEFDHLDPSQKTQGVNFLMKAGSLQAILEEIAKCEVVCANCHRERTHGPLV